MRAGMRLLTVLLALPMAVLAQAPAPKSKAPATTAKTSAAKPGAQAPKPWEKIAIPPLAEFHPQQPKRIALSNGMVLFLQEDHELPLIQGTIRIRGGARLEPAEKVGLVSIFGQAWRTGGTESKTGDQLDDFLESRAAKVETGGRLDSTNLSWSCLKEDFDDVFKAVLDVLDHPAFREDKIALAKQQINAAIARRNDDPDNIVARESGKLAYGAQSPYARVAEYYTVAAVGRDDLTRWRQQYVHANNMILGIAGDFDPALMEKRLREAFEDRPRGPEANRSPQVPISPAAAGIYFVQKDDVNQSTVSMLHLGIRRDNPDYYAVAVMNEILGGGFSGRLMSNLRTKAGLAYDVHGGVGSAFDHPGVFELQMETKSGTTAAAIDGLYGQVDDLEKQPATAAEMKRAKDTILNNFIFEFDDKEKVLRERMTYEFYGYPADFLERFRAGIEKVTSDDVDRVARKYVLKNQLAVLVLGNAADFDRELSTFGKVNKIDISIPEAPAGKPVATSGPPSDAPGRALAAKVAAALGGEAKLRQVKSVRQVMSSTRRTPQGEIPLDVEQTLVFPERAYVVMRAPSMTITTVLTPQSGTMKTEEGETPMPAEMREENLKNIKRDIIFIAQHAGDEAFGFTSAGVEKVGELQAKVVDVEGGGSKLRWYVDADSGRVIRAEFRTLSMEGPVDRVVDYSDFRQADGLTLPFKRTVRENGELRSEDVVSSIEINPQIDALTFEHASPK